MKQAAALLIAMLALWWGVTSSVAAEQRFSGQYGAVILVVDERWRKDPKSGDLEIRCEPAVCGRKLFCTAIVSSETVEETSREQYLTNFSEIIDTAFQRSAGSQASYQPTVPLRRRQVGANDGYYGEYNLEGKGIQHVFKTVLFQTMNKSRIVAVMCQSRPQDASIIRSIIKKIRLPS